MVAADLMLRNPKTVPGDATVAEVRAVLSNPRVQLVLLADGTTFRGAITELPSDAEPGGFALEFAVPSPDTIAPDEPAATAFARAAANPNRRVVVLDEHGALLGLLCLNSTRTRFCGAKPSDDPSVR
jgi:CBS domain-containing protein